MARKRVKNYDYIKRSDISVLKATIDGKVLNVDPKKILSGTYVAGKLTATAKKLRVAKIDPEKLRIKMLNMYEQVAEKKYNADFEKYVTVADIKKFVECGMTEEMIMAFYCGFQSIMEIKADNEFAYRPIGGIFDFRTDEDGKWIKNYISRGIANCENNVFELGFKYPSFEWKKVGMKIPKTDIIETLPYDFFGKEKITILRIETFNVKTNFKVLAIKAVGDVENGERKLRSGQENLFDPKTTMELNSGYLALVSRNGKELFALAKKLLSQDGSKGAYVKDFEWLVQNKTGGAEELIDKGYKFAKGGNIRTMQKGDAVIYRDSTWYITEKGGQVGIVSMRQGAWGSDYPFVPLTKISQEDELTDMYGNKVFIPYSFAKGGVAEHGLAKGDKITDDLFWENRAVVTDKDGKKVIVDLEKGKRGVKYATGGNVPRFYLSNEILNSMSSSEYDDLYLKARRWQMQELGRTVEGGEMFSLPEAMYLIYYHENYPKGSKERRESWELYKKYALDKKAKGGALWSKIKSSTKKGAAVAKAKGKEYAHKAKEAARKKIHDGKKSVTLSVLQDVPANTTQEDDVLQKAMNIVYKNYQFEPKEMKSKGGSLERIEINEDGTNIPEPLYEVFSHWDEDADPYHEAERLRLKAHEVGYDFDYDLSGAPTEFWKVQKANVGALLIAQKAKNLAPKSFDAADTKIANKISKKTFAERMSETGNPEYDQDQYQASQFAKGGKLDETQYIPRDEIIKVELKNGKVIVNSYDNPIYSGLRIGKGVSEREEMEEQGQLSMFKRGGKMPKYAEYVSQRDIAKVYLYDEDEPTEISGRDLVGGIYYDNEKAIKLIQMARKRGLID